MYELIHSEILRRALARDQALRGPLNIEITYEGVKVSGSPEPAAAARAYLDIYNRFLPGALTKSTTVPLKLDG